LKRETYTCDRCGIQATTPRGLPDDWWAGTIGVEETPRPGSTLLGSLGAADVQLCPLCRSIVGVDDDPGIGTEGMNAMARVIVSRWFRGEDDA
jgi:hypothetical protein